MAKKKKGQLQLKLGLNDERVPKLLGVLSLFFALYLFIAFTSYLFTWKIDQDKVFDFSWELLRTDLEMANWLGRLGAIISDKFFYWGFGLASFGFVYVLVRLGIHLIHRRPMARFVPLLSRAVLLILLAAIFLDFVLGQREFPWGGAFGEGVAGWLENFVGTIGLIFLFLLLISMVLIWKLNPNFSELTFDQAVEELKNYLTGLISRKPARSTSRAENTATNNPPTLRPGNNNTPSSLPEPKPMTARGEQLAFELEEKKEAARKKAEALRTGDAELEIQEAEEATPQLEEQNGPAPQPGAANIAASMENKDHSEPYDPTLELSSYEYPVLPLLKDYSDQKVEIDRAELEQNKDQIIETLLNYKIEITKIRATIGPTVTLYEIVPAPGVRISRIKNLEDDIALSLAALGIRIIAPIPGKGTIGIEVPNKKKQMVSMREVLAHDKFKRAKMDLPIGLGKTISNEVFVVDLAKMPHLLVAGATGQGKSVGINAILVSLLYKKHPSQVKLVLIDPKKVELFPYSRLEHHFLAFLPGQDEPITTETNRVIHTLNSLCIEMDTRYDLLKKGGARNIKEYNEKFVKRQLNPHKGHRFLPFIVLVIDEFADLIMTAGKEVELPIGRLAQLARAVGIHLIIATQRPSVNIITGVIKANFPARIAYKVTAKVDSRTILDSGGADQLIGQGDMLLSVGGEMVRLQGAFVDTPEVEQVIDFIAEQKGYPEPFFLPEYHGDDEEIPGAGSLTYADLDEEFENAARLIVSNQHGSTSMIQRRLKLGYNRAGRIMDQLEAMGIVGPSEGSKAREVLVYDEIELERFLKDLRERK
ncbi:FtsK/SpoIIIE family DNA translocase [Flavilitoribacter nigricans]|uniref:Cell division protein FtsK n=1 Tax=Flavilitoribacter nigricans (strain ATCC 23147 / DSM 23189 / NBRC 102662 / NCIMB 1420 / SS-2) TaxID=1122177 RepID=A0A2D0NF98_FLAN2|nr:DNA translocase FtsK [Flavilitoribacter nigricans]PHN07157.1 cell division protein FtsK [Flavilitoribacter nigricans DSM 23189 = NBRC 102662]